MDKIWPEKIKISINLDKIGLKNQNFDVKNQNFDKKCKKNKQTNNCPTNQSQCRWWIHCWRMANSYRFLRWWRRWRYWPVPVRWRWRPPHRTRIPCTDSSAAPCSNWSWGRESRKNPASSITWACTGSRTRRPRWAARRNANWCAPKWPLSPRCARSTARTATLQQRPTTNLAWLHWPLIRLKLDQLSWLYVDNLAR